MAAFNGGPPTVRLSPEGIALFIMPTLLVGKLIAGVY